MKKTLLILLLFISLSCSVTKPKQEVYKFNNEFSLKDEINKDIIEAFYNNDTTGISNQIYLLK